MAQTQVSNVRRALKGTPMKTVEVKASNILTDANSECEISIPLRSLIGKQVEGNNGYTAVFSSFSGGIMKVKLFQTLSQTSSYPYAATPEGVANSHSGTGLCGVTVIATGR